MNKLEASQQETRWQGSDISGQPLVSLAFGKVTPSLLYDISGTVISDKSVSFQCNACEKNFTTKQSLERHLERFPLCKNWSKCSESTPSESVYKWALQKLDTALMKEGDEIACRFCSTTFTLVGNLHKHFQSSVVCNKLAYEEVKKVFQ